MKFVIQKYNFLLHNIVVKTNLDKVQISARIYPIFEGISNDLLFFWAIKAYLYSDVKGFTSSQINILTTIGLFSVILGQLVFKKIVKLLGRKKSIQLGIVMALIAAIIYTFSNSLIVCAIGEVLYYNGFALRGLSSIIYANNLKQLNRFDDYLAGQNKASMLYAIITFVIALCSGALYNFFHLLPMFLCIAVCVFNLFFSNFLFEDEVGETEARNTKISLSKNTIILVLTYGLISGLVSVCMDNSTLIVKQALSNQYDATNAILFYSYIITVGRLIRVSGNAFYRHFYRSFKDKMVFITMGVLCISFVCVIVGDAFDLGLLSILLIALQYYGVIFIRDGNNNYFYKETLNTCQQVEYTSAYSALLNSANIAKVCFTGFAAICLNYFDFKILMSALLIIALIAYIPVLKSFKITAKNSK